MSQSHYLIKVSKFLSFVLRHKPEAINLTLDNEGWASVAELIEKAKPQITLTPKLIKQVVLKNDKKRFALSDDEQCIRANQGHSIQVNLQLSPVKPPVLLYHGTATRFLESIKQEGLKSKQRHHVHLSSDFKTAIAVGKRHGKPVVLEVASGKMYQQGFQFFLSNNGVWLTKYVPADFIEITTNFLVV